MVLHGSLCGRVGRCRNSPLSEFPASLLFWSSVSVCGALLPPIRPWSLALHRRNAPAMPGPCSPALGPTPTTARATERFSPARASSATCGDLLPLDRTTVRLPVRQGNFPGAPTTTDCAGPLAWVARPYRLARPSDLTACAAAHLPEMMAMTLTAVVTGREPVSGIDVDRLPLPEPSMSLIPPVYSGPLLPDMSRAIRLARYVSRARVGVYGCVRNGAVLG